MPGHAAELALLWCVLLNAGVFAAAYRFAAGRTASASQATLDAALIGLAVQYAAIGLPGMVGLLRPAAVYAVAIAASVVLASRSKSEPSRPRPGATEGRVNLPTDAGSAGTGPGTARLRTGRDRTAVAAAAAFAVTVVVGRAWVQADWPVTANDPLTYHFPAAVQWLQTGRLGPFPTWFFNPANGYSPLAGSTLIAWLMVPVGSDVLARFVGVPLLLATAVGVYRLARQLRAGPPVSAAVAVAAVACRPLLTAALMGKDDLLVTFTFVAAVVALAPDRSREPLGPWRFGLSVGLLLATKYTALLAMPLLLLAADGPPRRWRWWAIAATTAAVVAGPWYLRNWITTGNPVFPLAVPHLFAGLFTTARTSSLATVGDLSDVVLGGSYGLPWDVAVVATAGLVAAVVRHGRRSLADPMLRTCALGPALGVAIFWRTSPFPESRFLYPAAALLLAVPAAAVGGRWRWAILAVPAAAVATVSVAGTWSTVFGPLLAAAAVMAGVTAWVDARGRRWRAGLVGVVAVAVALYAYVGWAAHVGRCAAQWSADDGLWAAPQEYPADDALWRFVNGHLPPDATVAYADLHFTYPLQGPTLRRRLAYVPTRHGVRTPADLPWLGDRLTGERLVAAATAATVGEPDRGQWLDGLRRSAARYLVVGTDVAGPEAGWAAADRRRFPPLFAGPGGRVFAIVP